MKSESRNPRIESPIPTARADDGRNSRFSMCPAAVMCQGRAPTVRPYLSPAQRAGDTPTTIVLSPNGARHTPIHMESIVRFRRRPSKGLLSGLGLRPSFGLWKSAFGLQLILLLVT